MRCARSNAAACPGLHGRSAPVGLPDYGVGGIHPGMPGVYSTWGVHIPADWLVALATSPLRLFFYRLQHLHGPTRLAHLVSMAVFFGAILMLDLRLMGISRAVSLEGLARLALPWAYGGFLVAMASGVVLFLFDPIQVGSHTWFVPKLLLIGLGMLNVIVFHRRGFATSLAAIGPTRHGRIAGALSLLLWLGVLACATGNEVERPIMASRARATAR